MAYYAALLEMQDEEKNRTLRPDHLAYLEKCEADGRMFARGPFADGSGGLVVYRADSHEEAQRLAEADPYVANGARTLKLREWKLSLNPHSGV